MKKSGTSFIQNKGRNPRQSVVDQRLDVVADRFTCAFWLDKKLRKPRRPGALRAPMLRSVANDPGSARAGRGQPPTKEAQEAVMARAISACGVSTTASPDSATHFL